MDLLGNLIGNNMRLSSEQAFLSYLVVDRRDICAYLRHTGANDVLSALAFLVLL